MSDTFQTEGGPWVRIQQRFEGLQQKLSGPGPAAAEAETILRRRARELAQPPPGHIAHPGSMDFVIFALSEERYGLELHQLREVVAVSEIAPLPTVPHFVAGVFPLRGEIISVIDLKAWLALPPKGLSDFLTVLVMVSGAGLLVDRILGAQAISPDQWQRPPGTLAGPAARVLRGVTSEGIALLDGAKLMSEPALKVHEEV